MSRSSAVPAKPPIHTIERTTPAANNGKQNINNNNSIPQRPLLFQSRLYQAHHIQSTTHSTTLDRSHYIACMQHRRSRSERSEFYIPSAPSLNPPQTQPVHPTPPLPAQTNQPLQSNIPTTLPRPRHSDIYLHSLKQRSPRREDATFPFISPVNNDRLPLDRNA